MEYDQQIEGIYKNGKCLDESVVRILCEKVRNIMCEESNVVRIHSPLIVCGDIHGQLHDLIELFQQGGDPKNTTYLFMGDYVDRGYYSVETLELL